MNNLYNTLSGLTQLTSKSIDKIKILSGDISSISGNFNTRILNLEDALSGVDTKLDDILS